MKLLPSTGGAPGLCGPAFWCLWPHVSETRTTSCGPSAQFLSPQKFPCLFPVGGRIECISWAGWPEDFGREGYRM